MPPRSVDQAIARFDALSARLDGHRPTTRAARRHLKRSAASAGRTLAEIAIGVMAVMAAFTAYAFVLEPIGVEGFLLMILAILAVALTLGIRGMRRMQPNTGKPFSETMPNAQVVQTLDSFLHRRRAALPEPAVRRADAIAQQLPLLESRLQEVNPLDPLAQDARRLMGKHLPELIERYERVPPQYRQERDGEGMTVDDRLSASLEAADAALKEIGLKLAKQDMDAFETQGRFIESRYKDDDLAS